MIASRSPLLAGAFTSPALQKSSEWPSSKHVRSHVFKTAQIVVAESAPTIECRARDLSGYGARLCLSTTYGLPQQFDVIIDGKRRSVRPVWMTYTEMGVMFAEASQKSADLVECERDIASLIELLKMAEEKWPSSESYEISETEMLCRDQALLDMQLHPPSGGNARAFL